LHIPTIGIGAGPDCDAQVLVWQDMAGLRTGEHKPKFVKEFADLAGILRGAAEQYGDEVRSGAYPAQSTSTTDPSGPIRIRAGPPNNSGPHADTSASSLRSRAGRALRASAHRVGGRVPFGLGNTYKPVMRMPDLAL